MPTLERRLQQKLLIEQKKRNKLQRIQEEEPPPPEEPDDLICIRCNGVGHRDARSRHCPQNYRNRAVREFDEESQAPRTDAMEIDSGAHDKFDKETLASSFAAMEIDSDAPPRRTEQEQRTAGISQRRIAVASGSITRSGPCGVCSANGVYNPQTPHSSTRSRLCPYRLSNIDEYLADQLGGPSERFTRKIGLDFALSNNLNANARERISTVITEVVDFMTELTIKAQLFAAYFIIFLLEENNNLARQPVFFHQTYFYACLQLTLGQVITRQHRQLPKALMTTKFQEYSNRYHGAIVQPPAGHATYSHIMAEIAESQATTFTSAVSERFQHRLTLYFRFRVRELSQNNISNDHAKKIAVYIYNVKAGNRNATFPRSVTRTEQINNVVQQIVDDNNLNYPTPVNLTSLTAQPQNYLPCLYAVLQRLETYNDNQLELADDVQAEVSRRWVYEFIKTLPCFATLGKRKRGRVVTWIRLSVNGNAEFRSNLPETDTQIINERIHVTRTLVNNSRVYIEDINANVMPRVNRDDCFIPEASTFINNQRVFNLVPMCRLTRRFIAIDLRTLQMMMRAANAGLAEEDRFEIDRTVENSRERHRLTTLEFQKVFNLRKARTNPNFSVFANSMKTDGYAADFVFARRVTEVPLPDLDASDFTEEELQQTFRLWGLDPGIKSVYTACDGHTNAPHEIRKFSTAQFYTLAGYKQTNRRLLELKNSPEQEQVRLAEQNLLSPKTSRLARYEEYLVSFFQNARVLLDYYSLNIFRELRLYNHVGRQRATAEMVNNLISGGMKYSRPRRITTIPTRVNKWRPAPILNDERIPLIAFGIITFSQTMKGTLPGLAKTLYKALKYAEREGLLVVIDIDEHNTSQVCSKCQRLGLQDLQIGDDNFFSTRVCRNCTSASQTTIWQRDVNASRNMHFITSTVIQGNPRPNQFLSTNE